MFNLKIWLDTIVYTKNNDIAHQQLRDQSKIFIDGLTKWQKFILFHHTLRSAQINKLLKTGIYDGYEYGLRWVNILFNNIEENKLETDSNAYPFYYLNGTNISNIIRNRKNNTLRRYNILRYIMYLYISQLQTILLNAPILQNDIFIYKTTNGCYPEMPKNINCNNPQLQCDFVSVKQNTFNSTTLSQNFNFSKFYDYSTMCCYFIIYVPKGNKILHISDHIHGFPYQDEVLLPFGSYFNFIHGEMYSHKINIPKRLDIQKTPFLIGPVTIVDPDRIKERLEKNIKIKTYIVSYTRPSGIDCINTLKGVITPLPKLCLLSDNIFKYNHDTTGYLSGKFDNNLPLLTTYIEYINAFIQFSQPNDIIIFEFENVLGIPIEKLWESGVIKYDPNISKDIILPGPSINNLISLSKERRMITLVGSEQTNITSAASLLKTNNINMTTIGTILPSGKNIGYMNAINFVISTYEKPKRLFYIGSSLDRLNKINIPNTYKFYVNILETSIKVVDENIRNSNIERYMDQN